MFEELLRLLAEFGADADTIALAERHATTTADGDTPEGVEPLNDAELDTLLGALMAFADDDEASVALLSEAANTAEAIRGEQLARVEAAAEEDRQVAAERARLRGETVDEADPDPDPDEDEPTEDAPAETEDEPVPETAEEREPVTASARRAARRDVSARRPRSAAPATRGGDVAVITIGADVPGFTAGAEVASMADVNRALARRAGAFRGASAPAGTRDLFTVATIHGQYPDNRVLTDDPGRNGRLVDDALRNQLTPAAITASGGRCAPLTPYYGVEAIGDDRRPVRDALVGFQATRGGIVSFAPPTLANVAGASIVWTNAMDVDAATNAGPDFVADPIVVKPCLTVDCGTTRESEIYAVPTCLKFGNMRARTFGEWDSAISQLAMTAHARFAEIELLNALKAKSTAITTVVWDVSATRDVLEALARGAWGMRSRHRLPHTFPFRAILPEVLLGIMTEDIARSLPGGSFVENLTVAEAVLARFFASRNINVTWTPDLNVFGAQAAGALAAWPATVDTILFPEGTFLFLDGGTLDLGVVRDSSLNATNDFQTFVETFEGTHKLGVEALSFAITVRPTGGVAGTVDPATIGV